MRITVYDIDFFWEGFKAIPVRIAFSGEFHYIIRYKIKIEIILHIK